MVFTAGKQYIVMRGFLLSLDAKRHHRRDEHHRVADRGAGVPAARARDVGEIDHRPRLSGGAEGVRREHYTAATGRSAAW